MLEVGLGGRLDAVNVIDCDCAVITNIGMDHQEYLGNDRASIAREKAGIVRQGRPVVIGEPEPPETLLAAAARAGAPVFLAGRDFAADPSSLRFEFAEFGVQAIIHRGGLSGAHQIANRAAALAAFLLAVPESLARVERCVQALDETRLSGRLQRLCRQPEVLVDVGHNALAAQAISAELDAARHEGVIRCVIAMFRDKDVEAVGARLRGNVDHWYCAGLPGDRGQSGQELADRLLAVAPVGASIYDEVPDALDAAMADSGTGDVILVFGSFVTAATALKVIESTAEERRTWTER